MRTAEDIRNEMAKLKKELETLESGYRPKALAHRIRTANSGFLKNGIIYGGRVACPRMTLFRDYGHQSPIDERSMKTFAIGHANEEVFKGYVEKRGLPYKQEAFTLVNVSDNVELVFAMDFEVKGIPYELKSVSSTGRYKETFIDGKYKVENMAQLVQEMIELEAPVGVLRYTNYVYHSETGMDMRKVKALLNKAIKCDTIEAARVNVSKALEIEKEKWRATPDDRNFIIKIEEEGSISVDGTYSGFTMFDLLDHRQMLIDMFENKELPKPMFAKEGWPPCKGCHFEEHCAKSTCLNTEDFIEEYRNNFLAIDK